MKKICILPSESLSSYIKKGEIKTRYYNPNNYFDEVHIISFDELQESKEIISKTLPAVGTAKLIIHPIGRPNIFSLISHRKKILNLIKRIQPNVIRSYGPRLAGYFGVYAGQQLGIPSVVSLHGDEDRDVRSLLWKKGDLLKYVKHLCFKFITEPYAISKADKIICAYKFPMAYAKKYGAKDIELIYNRVDTEKFTKNGKKIKFSKPVIICVGRLIKEKNQECLINAVKNLDVILLLIGNGQEYENLVNLTKELGIEEKVKFIKSVPHSELEIYYRSSDIFAIAIKYGGIAIPVIEALASSLPLIVPKPIWEPTPELVGDVAMVVDNNPQSFEKAIKKLILDSKLRQKLAKAGRKIALKIDGKIMERKEMELYKKLCRKFNIKKKECF